MFLINLSKARFWKIFKMKKMKKIFVLQIIIFCCTNKLLAQKSYQNVHLGLNLTSVGSDFNTINLNEVTFDKFKNPQLNVSFGYKYMFFLTNDLFLSAGLKFTKLQSKFSRPHYDNSITAQPRSISERNKLSRLAIPVIGYFNFVNTNKTSIYILSGVDLIFLNNIKRTADYYIPSPPTGFTKNSYSGSGKVKFGKDGAVLGTQLNFGIGSNFEIREKYFSIEILYGYDISKSKFLTLQNIEDNSYFFSKYKGFQFTLGHSFRLNSKK